jgi:glycosyltransferase involved in cell wall biosynthesis
MMHNYYQQRGGEDAVFATEVELLRQRGHQITEFTADNRALRRMNPMTVAAQTIYSRRVRDQLGKICRQERVELVHIHNTFLSLSPSVYWACQELDLPAVQTLHNYRLLCPAATLFRDGRICEECLGRRVPWPGMVHGCYRASRPQTALVATMLAIHRVLRTWETKVDLYIALGEFARRKFIEGGIPAAKIIVKPNFVYPDPGVRESVKNYALFVGRLSIEKGVPTLLRAWRSLQAIPLKIVGEGPWLGEAHTFVQAEQLSSVDLMGSCSRSEVWALLRGARFLIFPSELYENMPMAIVEAFACGVPVITSRRGAMEEIVADGRTGLHFASGNPEDLAAKVAWAWTHSQAMEEMGREARREYELQYTATRNYERLMEIYQLAIERHKCGGARP